MIGVIRCRPSIVRTRFDRCREHRLVPEISKTADQALAVLLAVSEHQPASAAELCRVLEMNRTVAHRLLVTLRNRGFVRRVGDAYMLGPAAAQLASNLAPALWEAARPSMEQFAAETGETVVLQVVDGGAAVILAQVIGRRHVVRVEQNLIARHPLHLGASGRVLLAFGPSRRTRRILASVAAADEVLSELAAIRGRGYALSHDELQHGVHAASVPVLGRDGLAVAALAVLVPSNRAAQVPELVSPLVAAAKEIGALLAGADADEPEA
jgi:DNA-binding IclR family transcriptional regulator